MRTHCFLLFALLSAGSVQAQELACETCGCSPVTGPLQNFYEPGWVIQVNGQYSSMTTGLDGSQTLANPERQRINSAITQFSAAYNFSQEFGLQLNVPYINRDYRRTAGDHLDSGTLAGLGDITLAGRYTPVAQFDSDRSLVWNLQLGLKLPTGSATALKEELGHLAPPSNSGGSSAATDSHSDKFSDPVLFHGGHEHEPVEEPEEAAAPASAPELPESLVGGHDLALGSGSVDGVIGTSLFLREKSFFLGAGAQYLLRTRGAYGYQFGNAFLWNFSPGVLFVRDDEQYLGLQLNVNGEIKQQDNIQGLRIDHTGMNAIYAGPQFFASSEDLNFLGGVDFPLSQHTDGATLVPDYRIRVQMNWKL